MAVAGDPIQLGEQTAVLVRSYCSMGNPDHVYISSFHIHMLICTVFVVVE